MATTDISDGYPYEVERCHECRELIVIEKDYSEHFCPNCHKIFFN